MNDPPGFEAESAARTPDSVSAIRCPSCGRSVGADVVLCTACGYHFPTGRVLASASGASESGLEAGRLTAADQSTSIRGRLKPIGWGGMLAALAGADVISQTFMLAFSCLLYSAITAMFWSTASFGLFGLMLNGTFVLLVVRYYVVVHDVSILRIIGGLFALIWIALALSKVLQHFQVLGEMGELVLVMYVPAVTLALAGTLRLASVLCGQLLGVCERAALGSLVGGEDQGGVVDLARMTFVGFVGLLPLALVIAVLYARGFQPRMLADPLLAGPPAIMLGVAAAWLIVYFPMACGVVATDGSVNPLVVLRWIFRAFFDYCGFLIVSTMLSAAVAAAAAMVVFGGAKLSAGLSAPLTIAICTGSVAAAYLMLQYAGVAQATLLGFVLRRNEPALGWNAVDSD